MRISDWSSDVCSSDLLSRKAAAIGLNAWPELYRRMDRPFFFDNPDLPTLQPWANTTAPPAERFVARRNPYFHRVDATGRQLPYIAELILDRTAPRLIPTKAAAGEADLQARGLSFAHATALRSDEHTSELQYLMRI